VQSEKQSFPAASLTASLCGPHKAERRDVYRHSLAEAPLPGPSVPKLHARQPDRQGFPCSDYMATVLFKKFLRTFFKKCIVPPAKKATVTLSPEKTERRRKTEI